LQRAGSALVTGAGRPDARAAQARLRAQVVIGCLVAFYVLLPLDVGFPPLLIAGHPLNPAIVATCAAVGLLGVQSRGAVLHFLREPYCLVQGAYCSFLVVSAFASASPPSALHADLLFFSTFVLNYVVFRYVTRVHGIDWLPRIVVGVGLVAAALGVARGLFNVSLPMYDAWYMRQTHIYLPDVPLASRREVGTMNNPILYGVLMALIVPYIFDLKSWAGRAGALIMVTVAAGLTGSRTIAVGLVFGLGAVAVYWWRMVRVVAATATAVALLSVVFAGALAGLLGNARVDFLLQRAGLRPEANEAVSAAAFNLALRREALAAGLHEVNENWGVPAWLIGEGYGSAAAVGQKVLAWYTTVDNEYLTQLLEHGLIGLTLFVAAFVTFMIRSRRAARATLHWYAPLALALAGFSFSWGTYSTFNILVVGSMALAMWYEEQERLAR